MHTQLMHTQCESKIASGRRSSRVIVRAVGDDGGWEGITYSHHSVEVEIFSIPQLMDEHGYVATVLIQASLEDVTSTCIS